ncbi:hypothetical protein EON63_24390 [archaeon]|nr:MAG: hypothetical protein EON63_24390 [archaeon]
MARTPSSCSISNSCWGRGWGWNMMCIRGPSGPWGRWSNQVRSDKPALRRAVPSFILDGTVCFTQTSVSDLVQRPFASKLLGAFRTFCLISR